MYGSDPNLHNLRNPRKLGKSADRLLFEGDPVSRPYAAGGSTRTRLPLISSRPSAKSWIASEYA